MKKQLISALSISVLATVDASAAPPDELCPPLIAFVRSVEPEKTKNIKLRTSWGRGFSGMKEDTFSAKACEHRSDPLAIKLCDYWLKNSSTEFAGVNAVYAIECLSPETKFARPISVNTISIHFSFGAPDRGSLVDITLEEDRNVGGMALTIRADGY